MSATYDPDTDLGPPITSLDAHALFVEDLIYDERDFPQMRDPERIAVIVGVGQVNDRPADPTQGLDSLGLMVAALEAADRDAGGGWLGDVESVAVVQQISFRQDNPLARKVADRIGSQARVVYESAGPNGDSPILLLNEAANRIARGEIRIAAVTGGEALRTASQRAALAAKTAVADQNPIRNLAKGRPPGYRQVYGLSAPVDVYPLYENAGRAAYGQTLAEGQRESGEIWSRFSRVANETPAAWIHAPKTPDEVIEPTADNRPIAFPYTKLMVANSSVNQGAGFLVASLAEARRRGLAEARLIYVGMGAAAKEPPSILRRDRYNGSVSMETSINRTLALNGMTAQDFDFVELYSCFPCVPKMARRTLGWPVDRPATVFGGLTFGGGPIANYMSHAIVSMVEKLRREGRYGFLFANGGFATDNHCIVLGKELLMMVGGLIMLRRHVVVYSQLIGKTAHFLFVCGLTSTFFHEWFVVKCAGWFMTPDLLLLWLAVSLTLCAMVFYVWDAVKKLNRGTQA